MSQIMQLIVSLCNNFTNPHTHILRDCFLQYPDISIPHRDKILSNMPVRTEDSINLQVTAAILLKIISGFWFWATGCVQYTGISYASHILAQLS